MELIILGVGSLASLISAVTLLLAIRTSLSIAETQRKLDQRQLIIPLWSHMTDLNELDPANPVIVDVLKAVNTLELVALCCEGGMIDSAVIKRTFRAPFMALYDTIDSCPELPGLGKTGKTLLKENPAAMDFYNTLTKEHLERDKLTKI